MGRTPRDDLPRPIVFSVVELSVGTYVGSGTVTPGPQALISSSGF